MAIARPRIEMKWKWYWPGLTRYDAESQLRSEPDGTFLIHDSRSHENAFVLAVRCAGQTKMVLIYVSANHYYGFWQQGPFEFEDLQALVDHYRTESLAKHSPELSVCLTIPFCRKLEFETDRVKLNSKLVLFQNRIGAKNDEIDTAEELHRKLEQELQVKKHGLKAFDMILNWLSDHHKLATKNLETVPDGEVELMNNNIGLLVSQNAAIQKDRDLICAEVNSTSVNYPEHQASMAALRNDLKEVEREAFELKIQMRQHLDETKANGNELDCCHADELNWLMDFNRETAEEVLFNKPVGTFLIRPRGDGDGYALSVVNLAKEPVHLAND